MFMDSVCRVRRKCPIEFDKRNCLIRKKYYNRFIDFITIVIKTAEWIKNKKIYVLRQFLFD